MEVKLSRAELKAIAAEVAKLLGSSSPAAKIAAAPKAKRGRKPGAAKAARPVGRPVGHPRKVVDAPAAAAPQVNGSVFNIATAAEAAGQHPNTIRRHIQSGRLKSKIVKGAYEIKASDLESYSRSLRKNK